MAGIRGRDTRPEILLRSGLHRLGFRFRLHVRDLPGSPDLVLPRWRAAIFVHGCFWHGHHCDLFRIPSTRPEFWRLKIQRNRMNDSRNIEELLASDWRVLVVYECAMRSGSRYFPLAAVTEADKWLRSRAPYRELCELRRRRK